MDRPLEFCYLGPIPCALPPPPGFYDRNQQHFTPLAFSNIRVGPSLFLGPGPGPLRIAWPCRFRGSQHPRRAPNAGFRSQPAQCGTRNSGGSGTAQMMHGPPLQRARVPRPEVLSRQSGQAASFPLRLLQFRWLNRLENATSYALNL
ncbi:hypothetical protein DFH11DRAFT_1878754 [Phellopilus nigrolimitatus]|nr:hypothetical protein DFH11DRAFT_1878754 [Phellopilus nigrolimitatus]